MKIILSIKPKYVKKIIDGNKKYEFRKSLFRNRKDIKKVYIYSTSPAKKIVGSFKISEIIEDHPKNLWDKFKELSGMNTTEFFNYFGTKNKGFAIKIEKLEIFKNPIDPITTISNFIPPQSFYYIDESWRFIEE